ncbi:hypothetical protein VKT23_007661 [Stygiomarasmius scandens]|uniref:F-box domain-containing protein n=1 Tax=Marasmiellus scandens TaxID=2682957 RepID=A0ABR1JLP5_9AGAR
MFSEPERLDSMVVSNLLKWTRHCLEHSQNQPLEIVLHGLFEDYDDISSYECMNPFVDLLLEESQRWRRAHLSLHNLQIEVLSLPKTLPILEFFHLRTANFSRLTYMLPIIVAPRLQELVLSKLLLPPDLEMPRLEVLAGPNLTDLHLYHVSVFSTLQFLAQSSSFVSVNAYLAFYYQGPLMTNAITSHISALTTRSAGDLTAAGRNDPLCDLFNNIASLPNVYLFDFTGNECQGGPFPHAPFISFLSRRRSVETPITKLSFKWWILEDKFLLQILHLLPALEHLSIDENFPAAMYNQSRYWKRADRTLSSSFLRALSVPTDESASKCLVPRLTNLTLTFEKRVDYRTMRDMIQSRRGCLQHRGIENVDVLRLDYVLVVLPWRLVDMSSIETLRMMDGVTVKLWSE